MRLVFIYGPPAAGKFTIAKRVADRTGFSLFHNHLVVDAVGAVFPFGSDSFIRLREQFWLEVIEAATMERRSMVFTFQPEPSVAADFPQRVAQLIEDHAGKTSFVQLSLSLDEQLDRVDNADRARFGKLRDPSLLRELHASFAACEARMPKPLIRIDTAKTGADEAASMICGLL
jgi:hypothetical protein